MEGETRLPVTIIILSAGWFQSDRYVADHGHDHLAADGFDTVSFAADAPFSADRFQSFLEGMPRNVFRGKGILWIDGSNGSHVFHLVGRRFTLDKCSDAEPKYNRLVLIGQGLDGQELRARLASCLVATAIPAPE